MNTPHLHARLTGVVAFLTSSLALLSQTVPAPSPTPGKEETVTLSPFMIQAGDTEGYYASSTLAGTRVRTSLADIATSISVVTQEFLQDTASANAQDLLVYTTGTEVPGLGGNYAAPGGVTSSAREDGSYRNPNQNTRLRGLAAADLTRDYFSTEVPFDTYNTERVEINRGANSVLFGLGSPAGIINSAVIKPAFRDGSMIQLRTGSHGSVRGSFDVEKVLMADKLSFRLAALADNREYQTRPAFEDTRRAYGIVEYRPWPMTTIRLAGERGQIDANRPRLLPPQDSITSWFWTSPVGGTKLPHDPTAGQGFAAMPDGTRIDFFKQQIAPFDTPAVTYAGPGQAAVDPSLNPGRVAGHMTTVPRAVLASFPTFSTMAGTAFLLRAYGLPATQASFYTQAVVQDTSVFDFRNQLIDGPNKSEAHDFDIVDFSVEQRFLRGQAGLKYAYHRENNDFEDYALFGNGGPAFQLGIDINNKMTDGTPNANFGRPFITFAGGSRSRRWIKSENHQVTGYLETNLGKREGLVWRILGRQTFTGLGESSTRRSGTVNYKAYAWDAKLATLQGNRNNTGIVTNRARDLGGIIYLGPSLAGATSAAGAALPGVQQALQIDPEYTVRVYNVNTQRFEDQTIAVERDIPMGANLARRDIDTQAFVLQNHFWDGALVGMAGWRRDRLTNYNNLPVLRAADNRVLIDGASLRLGGTPSLRGSTETFSWSVVGHVPERFVSRLPGEASVSLHYGVSENTQLGGTRSDIYGRPIAPPSGETTEQGFTVTLFQNKLSFRANWYETVQARQSVAQFSDYSRNYIVREANFIAQAEELIAANPLGQADIQRLRDYPELPQGILSAWQVQDVAPGLRNVTAPAGLVATSDLNSKGLELELVWNITSNWRLLLNGAQQKVTRQNTALDYQEYIASRAAALEQFGHFPASVTASDTFRSVLTSNSLAGALTVIRQDGGAITNEIREWRWNAITNYTFSREGFLRGWNVGGAVRWQDNIAIGYPILNDPLLGWVPDVTAPIRGPKEVTYDAWVGYRKKFKTFDWHLQLNVRNLLDDDDLIPVAADPNGGIPVQRITTGRTWDLTSTFKF